MKRLLAQLCLLAAIGLLPLSLVASDRSHPKVLAAFREVVAAPGKSTVQVYADGYRAALGAIVRSDGYIVTKASELKGKIEVQLADSRKLDATIVGTEPAADLAVLHVEAKELPAIAWSDSAAAVGSWVATTGLGRDPVAIGVLSVAARKIDAPSGALGVRLGESGSEAIIEAVVDGMAADQAGLKEGDVVLKVNGKAVAGHQELRETIKGYMPGEKVELIVRRGGDEMTISVTLGSLAELMHGDRAEFQNNLGGPLSERRAGFPLALQHDTVLRPADCGGPLVDLDGKAVGLNIARAGRVESYALPASIVQEAVAKLIETQLVAAPASESAPAGNPPPPKPAVMQPNER